MNSARRVGAQSRAVTWPGLTSSWVLGLLATLSLELNNFYIDTVMNMEYLEYLEKEPWSAFSISKAASSAFTLQDFMRYLNRH